MFAEDEYVPPQVDVKLLTERMKKAITKSTPNLRCDIRLYEADHSLHGKEQEFAQDFIEFLKVVFP